MTSPESDICKSSCTGHAGDVIGDVWYITGGGNNTSGCTDTVALDLTALANPDEAEEPLTWSQVSQAEPRSAIVSEGLTVEAIPYAKCLLSFGGYNGKYQSALQIFKPGKKCLPLPHYTRQKKLTSALSLIGLCPAGVTATWHGACYPWYTVACSPSDSCSLATAAPLRL